MVYGSIIIHEESILTDNQISNKPLNKIIPIIPIFSGQFTINEQEPTLLIHSEYNEKYVINIHTKNGKLINRICEETIQQGNSSFNIDLNEYPSDDYYIVIVSNSTHDIIKFTI